MSEKFSMKFRDYETNWSRALNDLLTDTDLADVTLISDDKEEFYAHRIVLSSCSNMFKFIFKRNKSSNPLLFLGGVNSINLGYILDYIYQGEVSILQDQLDSFLESAQKLEIEGLLDNNQGKEANFDQEQSLKQEPEESLETEKNHHQPSEEKSLTTISKDTTSPTRKLPKDTGVRRVGLLTKLTEESNKKMKQLYEKTENGWRCLACKFTTKGPKSSNIRMHAETHMEGLVFTCHLCNREFKTRNNLNQHKNNFHKNMELMGGMRF